MDHPVYVGSLGVCGDGDELYYGTKSVPTDEGQYQVSEGGLRVNEAGRLK